MEFISTQSGRLAFVRDGDGQPVIFLHGGPGDTHHYMRRMSEPLWPKFQCVNYDQRGVGASVLDRLDESTLALSCFFEDLLAIKKHLGVERFSLVGHSWGAMLALYFNLEHPDLVEKLALVSMGPLDEANEAICSSRLMQALTEVEKAQWAQMRRLREEALQKRESERVLAIDRDLMALRVKSWVFDSAKRQDFLEEYFRDPPPDRLVNKIVFHSSRQFFHWNMLARIHNPVWVCYGEQDFAPTSQALEIQRRLPSASIRWIPECGHIPWLEKSEQFYAGLSGFLES